MRSVRTVLNASETYTDKARLRLQGVCLKMNCGLAHPDDGFPEASLVPQTHITQVVGPASIPPKLTGSELPRRPEEWNRF